MRLELSSITLNTNQLAAMLNFYEVLGCQFKKEQVDKGGVVLKAQLGPVEFHLFSVGVSFPASGAPRMQLALRTQGVSQTVDKLKMLPGVQVLLEPTEMLGEVRSIILDPDGNSIDLSE